MTPSLTDARRRSMYVTAGVSLFVIGGLFAVGSWIRLPVPLLREQLKSAQFWSLEAGVVLLAVLGGLAVREIWRLVEREDAIRMALLAVLACTLTTFVAPRTNRIYYDEQIYQGIGQNLADLKRAQMCNDGTVEYGRLQCWLGEYNKQPYAYPHLLSIVYRVTGVSDRGAFALNTAVMALTVCVVYLIVLVAFSSPTASLFAGLLIALTPQQLLWTATAAAEPSAALACVVALLFAAAFVRFRSTVSLAATGAATAYAIQFRPESVLIVPVIGLVLWPALREEVRNQRVWLVGLMTVALASVHFVHLIAVRNEGWGTDDARLSLAYVRANFAVNGPFYLADERFPVMYTLLAAWGAVDRRTPGSRAYVLYFLAFFGVYLLFYAGSYNYGADVRYSLMTYAPISVLGGLGAARLVRALERVEPAIPPAGALALALAVQFLWYTPVVRATTEEAWAARADVRFAQSVVPELGANTYVLTHNPGMFHVWGVNAGQMSSIVTNPRHLDFLYARYTGGVYIHWNFWCNVQQPVQQDFCQRALADNPVTLWKEYRERDQRLAFYRVGTVSIR